MKGGEPDPGAAEADETPRYPFVRLDDVPESQLEQASEALWDRGATGVEERDISTLNAASSNSGATLCGHFATIDGAHEAQQALAPRWQASVEFIVGDDWKHAWKRFFHPVRAGHRLVVRPSWEAFDAQDDDVVVVVDPGAAFGSGMHETTQLVLRELDRRIQGGESVLDVGCGSGLLAIAALRLGAKRATAIDTDPIAVEVTRDNAARNGVGAHLVASTTPLDSVAGIFEVVLANIQASVLIPMAQPLMQRLSAGGYLVLSGILVHQRQEVLRAFQCHGRCTVTRCGEWIAVTQRTVPALHPANHGT